MLFFRAGDTETSFSPAFSLDLSRTARIYGNLPMISPEMKSFDSFVARMGEGKGQILT
jgi:hypothetical protein